MVDKNPDSVIFSLRIKNFLFRGNTNGKSPLPIHSENATNKILRNDVFVLGFNKLCYHFFFSFLISPNYHCSTTSRSICQATTSLIQRYSSPHDMSDSSKPSAKAVKPAEKASAKDGAIPAADNSAGEKPSAAHHVHKKVKDGKRANKK